MSFALRTAVPSDIPAMYRLDLICFDSPFRFDLRSMRRFASEPGAIVVVAEQAEELAGFIIINVARHKTFSSGYVTTLDVHPQYRRQGVALRLLQEAEAVAIAENITGLRLHVFTGNKSAISFYEKNGFNLPIPTAVPGFYGDGLDAHVYVKNLIPYRP